MSRSNHVAKGKDARKRRYRSAVLRQIALHAASPVDTPQGMRWYVEPEEMLRRGTTLAEFTAEANR